MSEIMESAWIEGEAVWPDGPDPINAAAMRERPILETLGRIVARHGGLVALEEGEVRLTFDALWHAAGGLAARLADAPPGPVGLLLPPGAAYSVALFGCLAAGRVSVLLDPSAPVARNAELIAQTGAALLLVASGAPEPGLASGLPVMAVDAAPGSPPPPGSLAVEAPAFILCTSGSTGRPKAIVHSQHTALHKAWGHIQGAAMRPGDLCLSLSPPATTGGLIGMLACACAGAGFRFLDLRTQGIAGLIETIRTRPVRLLRAAPSATRLLAAVPGAAELLAGLRSVTLYGEPVLRSDVGTLGRLLAPGAVMFASYGSTESGSIAWNPSGEDAYDPVRTPVGRLVAGSAAAILDDDGRPCAPGVQGELVIRSRYNALGEWQDGRCVPGRLAPDPADPARRIHHTGDIGWRAADGVFVVLGRKDRMLKVNGQRIEPAEIEAAVRGCAGVEECAVVPRAQGAGQAIIAFVTLRAGAESEGEAGGQVGGQVGAGAVAAIRAGLRGRLGAGMMPSRIVVLEAMPLLPGGKIDLVALRGRAAHAAGA